jgi:hypothetical protein
MTHETLVVRGQLDNGAPCTCIDTPGLNDTGNNDSLNIVNMVRTLKEQVREVHTFVIVLNGQNPRLDQAHKDMISIFGKCFGSDFMQNMVLAFTRWHEDDASRERRADETAQCSNGFQGTPEKYREREFTEVFREAFHYTGLMRPIFGDFKLRTNATRVEKEQNAKARNFLSLFALTMDPFSCQNIEVHRTKLDEARGKLDEARGKLDEVQQKNDEMSAQYEEQKRVQAEEMEKIRKLMDDTNADNATKMKRLENKLHDAEKRAADASKNGGGGKSDLIGLISAMMTMMSLRGSGGGGGGGGMMYPPMMGGGGGCGGGGGGMGPSPTKCMAAPAPRTCIDGSRDMRFKANWGMPKYG